MLINLERALAVGDELGGHILSGHIDGVASIKNIRKIDDSHCLTISAPENLMRFIAAKGSIALDGVSLTVNTISDCDFTVNIIEHTWMNTVVNTAKTGQMLNLEIDILARYVARLTDV